MTARDKGIKETMQAVMDESGGTYYGAFCYTVAYRENMAAVWEQLIISWKDTKKTSQREEVTDSKPGEELTTEFAQQCGHWYRPGQGHVQQPCQWMSEGRSWVTIQLQDTEMKVHRWKVVPMEPECCKEVGMEQQGKAPKGFLSLTADDKASTGVQVKRSLADPTAVSMLGQSVVVAEAESMRYHAA